MKQIKLITDSASDISIKIAEEKGIKILPMNINFGIIESYPERIKNKRERYAKISERALLVMKKIIEEKLC